ncbi:DUF4174 domain-containing protein [Arundinibacter roseus]|uniref:DUF4174 domain-containing protein n=1 Tax=Arundinibacter roseus TaxID=2070510 RepID=A0A4R4KBP4_9BACT|nr:DUF4174 domain-containing protein [Arundinibacter roseus]TDB64116.1 DUF4174 domain-containing protein [Arundinibacter roseus]
MFSFFGLTLIASLWMSGTDAPLWEKMERLAWKNRVIVIYAPESGNLELNQQRQLLANTLAQQKERDLVIIECLSSKLTREDKVYINRHFNHDLTRFGVWLVGKDGGTKLSSSSTVPAEKFWALIDSMPMRQSEKARRNDPK